MAVAYFTNAASAGVPSTYEADDIVVPFSYTLASTFGAVVNDTLRLFQIPANTYLLQVYISHPDLETGGPTLTVQIGDSSAVDTFATTDSTSCRAAFNDWISAYTTYVAAILPKAYTTADYMIVKANAAAGTSAASGAFKGFAMLKATMGYQ